MHRACSWSIMAGISYAVHFKFVLHFSKRVANGFNYTTTERYQSWWLFQPQQCTAHNTVTYPPVFLLFLSATTLYNLYTLDYTDVHFLLQYTCCMHDNLPTKQNRRFPKSFQQLTNPLILLSFMYNLCTSLNNLIVNKT